MNLRHLHRILFHKAVNVADCIDVWFREKYRFSPKARLLECQQNSIPMADLDNTIGKSIGILSYTKPAPPEPRILS